MCAAPHTTQTYTCHRAERAAGFRHGNGTVKRRQDWSIGQTVNVGFMRDLTVIGKNTDGDYELVNAKGVRYGFQPHGGLYRVENFA